MSKDEEEKIVIKYKTEETVKKDNIKRSNNNERKKEEKQEKDKEEKEKKDREDDDSEREKKEENEKEKNDDKNKREEDADKKEKSDNSNNQNIDNEAKSEGKLKSDNGNMSSQSGKESFGNGSQDLTGSSNTFSGGSSGVESGTTGLESGATGIESGATAIEGSTAAAEGGAAAGGTTAGAGATAGGATAGAGAAAGGATAGAGAAAGGATAGAGAAAGGAAGAAGGAAAGAGGGIAAGGWIVIVVILVIVLILLIGDAVEDALYDDDVHLTTDGKMKLTSVIQEGSGEVTGDKEQLDKADAFSEKYSSYIGYTNSQIDYLYDFVTDDTDVQEGTNRAMLNNIYSRKYGSDKTNDTGLPSVDDNKELYKHIMNTEKYNFNKISWKVFSHNESTGRDMKDDEMYLDKDLGLKYPKDSTVTAEKFIDMATPYMLSSAIPRGFALSEAITNPSSLFASSIPSNDQKKWQLDGNDIFDYNGKGAKSESSLAYQIIKYGLSDITISKYVLSSYNLNTYYLKYIPTTKKDSFSVTVSYTENPNVQTVEQYSGEQKKYNANFKSTSNFKTDTISNGELVDTSNGDPKQETFVSESFPVENVYYLSYAKSFDIIKNFNYNYTPYSEGDTRERLRPDSESPIRSDYFEVENESYKFNPENILEGCSNLNDLINKKGCTVQETSSDVKVNESNGNVTYTYTYSVTGKEYTEKKGDRYDVARTWKDKVTSGGTTSKNFEKEQLYEFNRNEENDEGKSTITETELSTSEDIKHYESLIEKKQLNIIDIIDSNPKIYRNYLNSGEEASKYIGLGRENGDYTTLSGYKNIKKYFDEIAKDNKLPFVYGGSLGYEVETPGGSSSSASGMELLRQFVSHWEGHEGMADENMNKTSDESVAKYYYVDDIGDGVLTVGHGVNINAHMSEVKEATGKDSFAVGDWLEKSAIDKVQISILERFLEKVKTEMSGLNLTEYQLHALTDRCYVKGNVNGTSSAYKQYWNQENDDKYEQLYEQYKDNQSANSEITSKIDFENPFFKNHLDIYVSPTFDAKWPGYEPRQKSEFVLFSGGYYSPMSKFWSQSLSPGDINLYNTDGTVNEEKCLELQNWFEENIFGNNFHKPQTLGWSPISFSQYNATYVSYVTHDEFKFQYYSGSTPCGKHGLMYQCPWWAISRASLYLEAQSPEKWPNGLPGNLGDGRQVASNVSSRYGIPLNTDCSQIKPNSIVSYVNSGGYGHVAYVEAVDYVNNVYYISHCGSGKQWYGITKKQLGVATVGSETFVGSVCMDDLM